MTVERARRTVVVTGLLVALLAAVACTGGDDDSASSGTTVSPLTTFSDPNRGCQVLTKAEVEAAIAAPVRDGQATSGLACRYELASASDQAVVVVITMHDRNRETFESTRRATPGAQALSGVGDEAFVGGGRAFVLKGDTIAVVFLNLKRPAPELNQAAQELARAAAGRI